MKFYCILEKCSVSKSNSFTVDYILQLILDKKEILAIIYSMNSTVFINCEDL